MDRRSGRPYLFLANEDDIGRGSITNPFNRSTREMEDRGKTKEEVDRRRVRRGL